MRQCYSVFGLVFHLGRRGNLELEKLNPLPDVEYFLKREINFIFTLQAITLAKTCESTSEMRECRSPRDWSLLALQNTRTGKSHYLVICRCPDNFNLG